MLTGACVIKQISPYIWRNFSQSKYLCFYATEKPKETNGEMLRRNEIIGTVNYP